MPVLAVVAEYILLYSAMPFVLLDFVFPSLDRLLLDTSILERIPPKSLKWLNSQKGGTRGDPK